MKTEKVLNDATIIYLVKNDKVLLALKTKKIGEGRRNGYGGGIETGETPIQCAIRELEEETGVITQPEYLEKIAIVDFYNTKSDGEKFVCKCHVFRATHWSGDIKETETMIDPRWFPIDNLPFEQMMAADRYWLVPALAGKKIIARAHYGPFQKELLSEVVVQEADYLPEI